MSDLLPILSDVLLPIVVMIALGALLRRAFAIDVNTLVKINLYGLLPAFIFRYVATSRLEGEAMGGIVVAVAATTVLAGLGVWVLGRGARRATTIATVMAVTIQNCGNYGVPLAILTYGETGGQVQTFVLASQNLLTFTLGVLLAGAAAGGGLGQATRRMLAMPMPYALAAGLAARPVLGGEPLPVWLDEATKFLGAGLVPVALLTLGAQLAVAPRWPRWGPTSAALAGRLLAGPLLMAGLLGLARVVWPGGMLDLLGTVVGDVLIVTAAVPTGVNTLLLTLEMKGDEALAADAVFWTTLASAASVPATILLVRSLG